MELGNILLLFIIFAFMLLWGNVRLGWPWLTIVNRWVRWGLVSFIGAYFLKAFEIADKPFWVLLVVCFLAWFLLETVYMWLGISALSKSSVPLFPSYQKNNTGEVWPARKRFIELKEEIRRLGFSNEVPLMAKILGEVNMFVIVMDDEPGLRRLQVVFLPRRDGAFSVHFVVTSLFKSGGRCMTDNIFMPFGGFYPSNWYVRRKPLTTSLSRLLEVHDQQVKMLGKELEKWVEEPLVDLNQQQRMLQQLNMKKGFLLPPSLVEEYGKITNEGRYRLWKEIWLMNYLGLTVK
ncbi:MAG: hypothetical protein COX01_05310 [Verrucomicrobia bacterium CG22_combo_CG10-13_8_21_14_all_43_17]|nr:MAG: hypothetical protein AUJ82_04890 [Verrucomicrobia bacterium CG1_02_43_26]PIP58970.1 MAG: hypothetical protein COX01_05310 [Verrucomicrobia bacterium CG22_combo_CG10-13_8_21_14_all_43_17]